MAMVMESKHLIYQTWGGRTVIGSAKGVDLSERVIGEISGEEYHYLTVAEMPSHKHRLHARALSPHNTVKAFTEYGISSSLSFIQAELLENTLAGGNQPHNNMPPFIYANK